MIKDTLLNEIYQIKPFESNDDSFTYEEAMNNKDNIQWQMPMDSMYSNRT